MIRIFFTSITQIISIFITFVLLAHNNIRLDDLTVSHVPVGLVDVIQLVGLGEDLARVDVAVQNRLQQNLLVVSRNAGTAAGN